MASVNKVILVGNLGADPETRSLPSGDKVVNLRIATTDRYRDKHSGEIKESTEWHRIVLFNRIAEIANQYLRKGSSIYIEGRIRTRKWQDQNHHDRYLTEIIGDQMQMLGNRGLSGTNEHNNRTNEINYNNRDISNAMHSTIKQNSDSTTTTTEKTLPNVFDAIDDDIPF